MEENISDPHTLGEKVDQIGAEIIAICWNNIIDLKHKKGKKLSEEDQYYMDEMQRQHKIMVTTYERLRKAGRIREEKDSIKSEREWYDDILKMKSTVGSIVRETLSNGVQQSNTSSESKG